MDLASRDPVKEYSLERNIPVTRFILDFFYKKLKTPITLLGVSPISVSVIDSCLLVAREHRFPLMFIASLNQVDIDGGYTGWTPQEFTKTLYTRASRIGFEGPIIVALDHGGPWLKDKHVQLDLGFEEAMEWTMKSIEAALIAGYNLIHIDTTVDIYAEKPLSEEVVAERTLDLIEYAESIRKTKGLPRVDYEVGSDRWGIRDPERIGRFLSIVRKGLSDRGLREADITFVVGDLGTRVAPHNVMDVNTGLKLVEVARNQDTYVKGHSTDYVENPQDYRRIGIGGANVGPEFADAEYRGVKKLVEKIRSSGRGAKVLEELLSTIVELIEADGRWKKYVSENKRFLRELEDDYREWVIGICSRYVWQNERIVELREKIYEYARDLGFDGYMVVIREIADTIKKYATAFGLEGTAVKLREAVRTD